MEIPKNLRLQLAIVEFIGITLFAYYLAMSISVPVLALMGHIPFQTAVLLYLATVAAWDGAQYGLTWARNKITGAIAILQEVAFLKALAQEQSGEAAQQAPPAPGEDKE